MLSLTIKSKINVYKLKCLYNNIRINDKKKQIDISNQTELCSLEKKITFCLKLSYMFVRLKLFFLIAN